MDFQIKSAYASGGHALPNEVLAVLPSDPYEQLNLAHSITCRAYSQRVASLEGEAGRLRKALDDRAGHVRILEARLAGCQLELQQALDKVQQHAEAQARADAERAALSETVHKLGRELARLEAFKRNLLHSLQAADQGQEEPPLKNGSAQRPLGMPAQDILQSPALHGIANDPSRSGLLRPGVNHGSQEPHAREAAYDPPPIPNGAPASPVYHSSGRSTPPAGYRSYGLLDEAMPHLSQHAEARPVAHNGDVQFGQRSAAQQERHDRDGRGGYGSPLDWGPDRSGTPDQAAAAPREALLQSDAPLDPGTGAFTSGDGLFSRSTAGYREARSAEHPAHRMEGYSSALPRNTAPTAAHYRASGHHTPSEARATPPPELQQQQFTPSSAAFPPHGGRSAPPERDCQRREPEGVPRHGMQQHDMHAGLPEGQPRWSSDGEAVQRRPEGGGAAAHAGGMGGADVAGHLGRGSPAPGGNLRYGGSAPAEPLDGKEFFRRARARLSNEAFARFLGAIKELNAGRCSREQVLGEARGLFGQRDADLYAAFEGLLHLHLPGV